MRTLYLECNMGAAGDMLMSALSELVEDKEGFYTRLNEIGIPDVEISWEKAVKCGITGTHAKVLVHGQEEESLDIHEHEHGGHSHEEHHHHEEAHTHEQGTHSHAHEHEHTHHHAGLQDIYAMIDGLKLTEEEKEDIRRIYMSIAEAEAKVHGRAVTDIHFHEVGRADALADIAGCVMLMHELKADRIVASPVNVGFGQVRCAHGILPVPAPATSILLQGIPCYAGRIEGELCTPTGAALLKYFADEFRVLPVMRIEKTGYGMGKKDFAAANCVRAVLGESEEVKEQVTELCCNLDDMTPEELGFCMELLLEQGALEAFTTAVGMKKSRPGILLTVLCKTEEKQKFAELIFKHTSTIGIREHTCDRMVLNRSEKQKQIAGHAVHIKVSEGYGVTKEKAEYEDLKRVAMETGLSIRDLKKQL